MDVQLLWQGTPIGTLSLREAGTSAGDSCLVLALHGPATRGESLSIAFAVSPSRNGPSVDLRRPMLVRDRKSQRPRLAVGYGRFYLAGGGRPALRASFGVEVANVDVEADLRINLDADRNLGALQVSGAWGSLNLAIPTLRGRGVFSLSRHKIHGSFDFEDETSSFHAHSGVYPHCLLEVRSRSPDRAIRAEFLVHSDSPPPYLNFSLWADAAVDTESPLASDDAWTVTIIELFRQLREQLPERDRTYGPFEVSVAVVPSAELRALGERPRELPIAEAREEPAPASMAAREVPDFAPRPTMAPIEAAPPAEWRTRRAQRVMALPITAIVLLIGTLVAAVFMWRHMPQTRVAETTRANEGARQLAAQFSARPATDAPPFPAQASAMTTCNQAIPSASTRTGNDSVLPPSCSAAPPQNDVSRTPEPRP